MCVNSFRDTDYNEKIGNINMMVVADIYLDKKLPYS